MWIDIMNTLDDKIRDFYRAQRMPDRSVAGILAATSSENRPFLWLRPCRLAAAAALLLLLGSAALWWSVPRAMAGRVTAEVAKNHLQAYAPEVFGDCFDRVGAGLDQLDFRLKPSLAAALPEGLTVLGGRYCSIHGEPAAQILMVDAEGRRCTLFVALSNDTRLARVRTGQYEIDGVRVHIWHDAGRLFAMAV